MLPVIGGLLLRSREEADAPVFLSAYQDDEIRRWHTRRPSTEDQVREWFEAYRQDWKQEKGGHWAITRDDGAEVLGRLALRGLDFDDGTAGVAYWVTRPATTPRAGSPPTPATFWKAPSAAPPYTTTADTACICMPASEVSEAAAERCAEKPPPAR